VGAYSWDMEWREVIQLGPHGAGAGGVLSYGTKFISRDTCSRGITVYVSVVLSLQRLLARCVWCTPHLAALGYGRGYGRGWLSVVLGLEIMAKNLP